MQRLFCGIGLAAVAVVTPALIGCGSSHHGSKGSSGTTISPVARTVRDANFKHEDAKVAKPPVEKHGD